MADRRVADSCTQFVPCGPDRSHRKPWAARGGTQPATASQNEAWCVPRSLPGRGSVVVNEARSQGPRDHAKSGPVA